MTALVMTVTGALIGGIFDVFRSLRKAYKKHPGWIVNTEDTVFLILSFTLLIVSLNSVNFGQVRWYMFFLIALGVGAYYLGVGPWFGKILTFVFAIPGKIAEFFSHTILKKGKNHYIIKRNKFTND